jgi:sugar lactone lactonase YvrE
MSVVPRAVATLLVALLAFAAPGACRSAPDMPRVDHEQLALEAYHRGDHEEMLNHLRTARAEGIDSPRLRYNLACAEALNGHVDAAMELVEQVVAAGFGLSAPHDPDLAVLRDHPRFPRLLAAIERQREPHGDVTRAFSVPGPDLIPEGLAHDPLRGAFFLSSLRQRKVLRIDGDGTVREFVRPAVVGRLSPLGMKVDGERRLLWIAAGVDGPGMEGYVEQDLGRSALLAVDADTGALVARYELDNDDGLHLLNDVALGPDGSVYVSDSKAGAIYRLRRDARRLERLVASPRLAYPNGLALSADGRHLYVACSAAGLLRLDLDTSILHDVPAPEGIYLGGIDGLYRHRDALVAVQAVLGRVTHLRLDPSGGRVVEAETVAAHQPEFRVPTTGAVHDDEFFLLANSQLDALRPDGSLPPLDELADPMILRVRLPSRD